MNPHFSVDAPERPHPKGLYAQVDFIEPLGEGLALVGFDGVDAQWFVEFSNAVGLNKNSKDVRRCMAFSKDAPLFHLQVTMFFDDASRRFSQKSQRWLFLDLSNNGKLRGQLYQTLFSQPQSVAFDALRLPSKDRTHRLLNNFMRVPDQAPMPHSGPEPKLLDIEELAVLDVGQGSANALLCREGIARLYFDVGCGVYRNAPTRPPNISFCQCENPVVVLSHWDADHWAGATIDTELLKRIWIAPVPQTIKHIVFLMNIWDAGGTTLLLSSTSGTIPLSPGIKLVRCEGPASNRNESGLALIAEREGKRWLLPGDASYHNIPGALKRRVTGLVATHHGARVHGPGALAPLPAVGYARLAYSFGPGNAHGNYGVSHPRPAGVHAYHTAGWTHAGWSGPLPGNVKVGSPHHARATAQHPVNHLHGIRIGWTVPTSVPAHLTCCPKAMPLTQT
ncbi:hypothetical protein VDR45_09550 [Xanthomonas campestris pv. campestris]|nr:hypothetical protein [Xanthomonas campestris pv. campestris]